MPNSNFSKISIKTLPKQQKQHQINYYLLKENPMLNLGLEMLFWLTIVIYIGARLAQTKKGYKQQY